MISVIPMFWIANINVGTKRLLFLFSVEICILLITWKYSMTQPFSLAIAGSLITLIIVYFIAAYKYGIFIRRYSFVEHGEKYEINDFYKPLEPLKNYRVLSRNNSNQIDSKIFLAKQTKWAYFDNIRTILQAQTLLKHRNILLLGGGGGALAKTVLQSYPLYHIDVVEISKTMVSVAKRFFLSPPETKKITLLCQDALTYVTHTRKKYDVIIVDLFINSEISKDTVKKQFIHDLARVCTPRTILFVNYFGVQEEALPRITYFYRHAFPNFQLYLQGEAIPIFIASHKLKTILPHYGSIVFFVKHKQAAAEKNTTLLFSYVKESV